MPRQIFFVILFLFAPILAKAEDVALILGADIATFNSAAVGVKEVLVKSGYSQVDTYDASKDSDFVSKIKAKNYKVICALGSSPFKKVKDLASSTPVIFSMVLDPIESGVVTTLEPSGQNYTGVSLDVPAKTQMELLKKIIPSARKVVVIYTVKSERLVEEAKSIQGGVGLDIEGVKIENSTEVPNALRSLPQADVLWVTPDVRVCTKDSLPFILNFSSEKKLPVFAFADYLVKAGALFSYAYNYKDVGAQTGDLLVKVLGGESVGSIAVAGPRNVGYSLNTKTAKYLNISWASSVLSEADQKFE